MSREPVLIRSSRSFKSKEITYIRKVSLSEIRQNGDFFSFFSDRLLDAVPYPHLGLLVKLLKQGPHFQWSESQIRAVAKPASTRAVAGSIRWLKEHGYLKSRPCRKPDGTLDGHAWFVTPIPFKFTDPETPQRRSKAGYRRSITEPARPEGSGDDGSSISTITYNHTLPSPVERVEASDCPPGNLITEDETDSPGEEEVDFVPTLRPLPVPAHNDLEPPRSWGANRKQAMAWVRKSHFAELFRSLVQGKPEWTEAEARSFYRKFHRGTIKAIDILTMKRLGAYSVMRAAPLAGTSLKGLCSNWCQVVNKLNADACYSDWIMAQKDMLRSAKALHQSYEQMDLRTPPTFEEWRKGRETFFGSDLVTLLKIAGWYDATDEIKAWLSGRTPREFLKAVGQMELSQQFRLPYGAIVPDAWRAAVTEIVRCNAAENVVFAEALGDTQLAEDIKRQLFNLEF